MKRNFADQPTQGGGTLVLNPNDFIGATPQGVFTPSPRFIDNCNNCNMNTKMNATGSEYEYDSSSNNSSNNNSSNNDGFSWGDALGYIEKGADYWISRQKGKTDVEIAQIELERQRYIAQQEKLKSGSAVEKIKAYAVPIAIIGGIGLVGMVTYILLKRKK
jgi:hypothetical protein